MSALMTAFKRSTCSGLAALALSCSSAPAPRPIAPHVAATPAKPSIPVAVTDPLATPPPPGPAPETPFPSIHHARLDDGLELRVVARTNYPLVEMRLVVFSGVASDGDDVGVAALAGELLKAGGAGDATAKQLAERAESLGSRLDISTTRDSTRISMAVTTGDFERALELVATVAREPRFSSVEFDKLKQRAIEDARDAAKGDADYAARMVLERELFAVPSATHPYAHYEATPEELSRLTLENCKRWYRANVTPQNATLIVAGDVDPMAVESAARRVFSAWKGAQPPARTFPQPKPASEPMVWLVDRPHSAQSQIYVAGLGPERASPAWPALSAGNQILGGGVAGRLFLDVREKRSLAYHAGSSLEEVAHGPVPLVLVAGTQTAKTGLALQAMLDNLQRIAAAPPTSTEVTTAVRSLSDRFLFGTETLAAVADLTAQLAVLGLPDSYFDDYRHALAKLDPEAVFAVTHKYYALEPPVIVVAGDANVLSRPLSHFANVAIVAPEREFAVVKRVEHDAAQPLEAPGG